MMLKDAMICLVVVALFHEHSRNDVTAVDSRCTRDGIVLSSCACGCVVRAVNPQGSAINTTRLWTPNGT